MVQHQRILDLVRSYKMEKIEIITSTDLDGNEYQTVIIDRGNGEFTSIPKAVYETQQAQHLMEIPTV